MLRWRQARYAREGLVFPAQLDLRLNLTLNSALRSSRGVFSSQARRCVFGEMNLPDLDDFMKVANLDEKDTEYQPIVPAVIEEMKKGARRLLEAPAPNYRLHELRKHTGPMIYTRDGVAEAALFLRDSVQTTLKHYAHLLNPVRPS